MRFKPTASSILALAAAGALAGGAARAQQVTTGAAITITPSNANVLNLLSPILSFNATSVGQAALSLNLSQAIATNNNATAAQQALAVSDKNLFGGRTNTITLLNGTTATYGIAANLAGGLPAQAQVTPAAGATTTTNTTPIQAVGGLGSLLGPIYQRGVAPIGTGAATTAILANTATLLNTAYTNYTSIDLGVAKNYFANGAAANSANAPFVTNPARAPAGYTLPTYTLPSGEVLPNTTNSVLDIAAGVKNTGAGQDVYGSSRPVQVAPTPPGGINQFDSTSIAGLNTNPSFPSGHTTYAFTDSILIGMLVPQAYRDMVLRGSEYGNSRIVLGVHYPLDIIASRSFVAYDLAQAFTNAAYQNGTNTATTFNLATQFAAANGEIQRNLAVLDPTGQCGGSVAACATSAANTANDPYAPSAANAAIYAARLTYGLPTFTLAQAPAEGVPANSPDAAILLAPLYGGSTAAAAIIAPGGGINASLSTATIDQIIMNTEGLALQALYGTQWSYYERLNLYAAADYFNGVTGTLSLAATDRVTQNVTVASGGTLDANGTVTGTTAIASGGTLTGSGVVNTVMVGAGGTLAPGSLAAQAALQANARNVAGTTLVTTGGVTFAPTATFAVSASQAQTTSLTAAGAATLNGAAVTVTLPTAVGAFPQLQNSRILLAAGGVAGTFSGVTANLLFATPTLSYDTNDVYLSLGGPNFRVAATTRNQTNVATALNVGAAANPNSAVVTNLETLSSGQGTTGAAALGSLSGSGITATQNLAHRSAAEFTSSIFDQTTVFGGAATNSMTFSDEFAARAQGFAPVRELADLPATRTPPAPPAERPRSFRIWATGFGGVENIAGNAGVGFGAENNQIVGGSAGIDYQFLPGFLAGIAAGGTSGTFNVPAFATSGSTTGGHVAGYTLANFGASYGAASLAGSFYSNKTVRTVAAGTLAETDNGAFNSRELRLRIEGGRRFAGPGIPLLGSVTPFVALEIADLRSSGFTEFNRAGPTVLGLNINGQDSADVPAFVGARFEGVTTLGNGMVLTPALQVAYVHEFAPQRREVGSFAGLPQAVFLVDGARPAYNLAQVKAGGELAITPRAALFANFDGEFSGVSQFYGGKGGLRVAF